MGRYRQFSVIAMALCAAAIGFTTVRADEEEDIQPSRAAVDAVKQLLPEGRVTEAETERLTLRVYELEVKVDGRELDVEVTEDGTILSVDEAIDQADLPAAVAEAVAAMAEHGSVSEVEKSERHGKVTVTPLDHVQTVYEIKLKAHGREREVLLSDDGKPVKGDLEMDDADHDGGREGYMDRDDHDDDAWHMDDDEGDDDGGQGYDDDDDGEDG